MEPRQVAAGQGWQWIVEGFELFKKSPIIWVALSIILLLIAFIAWRYIPILGPFLLYLLWPVFVGGLMIGCQAQQNGAELEIAHLFAGFRKNTNSLVALGGINIVGNLIIGFVILVLGGGAMFGMVKGGQPDIGAMASALSGAMLALLVGLALYVPLAMALWFAPALAVLNDMQPVPALKSSFDACLKNIIPFLIYGIALTVLSIIACIPLFLGFLVLIPVIFTSIYASYRDIYAST
ncbi:MAG TPA: BPSS1780 family membrane protein [Burkholderiales bacterium]|nr:BPSS1780 family membrane protein [Burkholderiales bacterium]